MKPWVDLSDHFFNETIYNQPTIHRYVCAYKGTHTIRMVWSPFCKMVKKWSHGRMVQKVPKSIAECPGHRVGLQIQW
jgi:hypothetical protein